MTFLIFSILTDVSFSLVFTNQSVFIIPFSWRPGKIEGQMVLYAPMVFRLTAPISPKSEENNNTGCFWNLICLGAVDWLF